jgi:dipeptidase
MCDTLCAPIDGARLFGKSSDRPVGERQVLEAHGRRAPGGRLGTTYLEIPDAGAFALVGSRPDWMWGFEHGVNERGVAIGNEEIWTVDDPSTCPDALTGMDLVRLGLERGATATEAVEVMTTLLDRHGQGGVANRVGDERYFSSFLACDPAEAWVLETSGRTWAARRATGPAAISNRVTLGADWDRASADVALGADFDRWRHPQMWTGHADVRLASTRATAATASSAADVVAGLRDHGDGPWGAPYDDPSPVHPLPAGPGFDPDTGAGVSVCMHLRGFQATASSLVAVLDGGPSVRAWAALGSPCASVYVPLLLVADHPTAGVPRPLGEVGTAARFATLARSVEDPDGDGARRLAAIRAVLGPLESDLWQEADELFSATAAIGAATLATYSDQAWRRVDAALTSLGP